MRVNYIMKLSNWDLFYTVNFVVLYIVIGYLIWKEPVEPFFSGDWVDFEAVKNLQHLVDAMVKEGSFEFPCQIKVKEVEIKETGANSNHFMKISNTSSDGNKFILNGSKINIKGNTIRFISKNNIHSSGTGTHYFKENYEGKPIFTLLKISQRAIESGQEIIYGYGDYILWINKKRNTNNSPTYITT